MKINNNKTQKKISKRESILEAAIVAFPKEGFEKTSMDTIAETAGASKTTVYQHFPSKEILFEAVIEKYLNERKLIKSTPVDENLNLREHLAILIDRELSFVKNSKWLGISQVFISVFLQNSKLALKTKLGYEYAEIEHLVLFLQNSVKNKKLKIKNIPFTAGIFYSMVQGILVFPFLMGTPLENNILSSMKSEVIEIFLSRYEV